MNESEFLRAAVGVLDRVEAAVDEVIEACGLNTRWHTGAAEATAQLDRWVLWAPVALEATLSGG